MEDSLLLVEATDGPEEGNAKNPNCSRHFSDHSGSTTILPSPSLSISNSIHNITELLGSKFWEEANWLDIVCEVLFHIKRRNTTIESEIFGGIVQFVSCMYVLPVIPEQMVKAGYDPNSSYAVTVNIVVI
jgi:hypothetical protein